MAFGGIGVSFSVIWFVASQMDWFYLQKKNKPSFAQKVHAPTLPTTLDNQTVGRMAAEGIQ